MMYRLLNKYFDGRLCNLNLDIFDSRFEDLVFQAMVDIDVLKITLYYSTNKALNGRNDHYQVNFSLLDNVDDIDHFQNCSWGCLLWETIYDSLDNALKGSGFKLFALKTPSLKLKDTMFVALSLVFSHIEN